MMPSTNGHIEQYEEEEEEDDDGDGDGGRSPQSRQRPPGAEALPGYSRGVPGRLLGPTPAVRIATFYRISLAMTGSDAQNQ